MEKGGTEWRSRHLGHDLSIHKDYYKLHKGIVEN